MTVHDVTEAGQTGASSFTMDLPHSPPKVWRALTDPELLSTRLLPVAGFDLTPGTTFVFSGPAQAGWDGQVHCRVEHAEPLRYLQYRWDVADILATVVSFTLSTTVTGTRLDIVQSGFRPDQKQNFGGARYGWRMMGTRLIDLLTSTP